MRTRKVYAAAPIGIRVHPDLKAWLETQADQQHMAVSTLIRPWIQERTRQPLVRREVDGHDAA